MGEVALSAHARDMLLERSIAEEWLWLALRVPDCRQISPADGNVHYIKAIAERDGRYLRVIINEHVDPHRVLTVFFDRRLGRAK
jgi:hypothetical protein